MGVSNQNIGTQFTTYSEVREKLPLEVMWVSRIGTCSPSMASDIREFCNNGMLLFKSVRELSLDGTSAEEKYHL
jgi:hypothetical protein